MYRDTVITARQKRREVWILLACFAAAFIFNIAGIIKYNSPASELFSQLHIVLLLAVFFYFLIAVLRGIYIAFRWLYLRIRPATK